MEKLIARGAEAELWLKDWNQVKAVVKVRLPKRYRHPELDNKLRRSRTSREAYVIHRAKMAGIATPLIYLVDLENAVIVMEYVEGVKIRDFIHELNDDERFTLFKRIGYYSGVLHCKGIIHGDLTTSNIIKQENRVVFIDFGLSEVSNDVEKRGVDLNLMNRMLTSTHYKYRDKLLEAFKDGYRVSMGPKAEEALNRMKEVAMRGRYIEKE